MPERRRLSIGIGLAVVAVLIGIVVFGSPYSPYPIKPPPTEAPTVMLDGSQYHYADVDLPHCQQPSGSSTPSVNAHSGEFTFSMRIESCFVPGALKFNGTCTPRGGSALTFTMIANQVRDAEGWIVWVSADGAAAVRWDGGYVAQVLSRAQ